MTLQWLRVQKLQDLVKKNSGQEMQPGRLASLPTLDVPVLAARGDSYSG